MISTLRSARRPRRFVTWMVAVVAAAGLISGCSDDAAKPTASPSTSASSVVLLAPVDYPDQPLPKGAVRAGVASLDPSPLLNSDGTGRSAANVLITLFGDTRVTADLTFSQVGGISQWQGPIDGVDNSTVLVVRSGDAYRMGVLGPDGNFQVTGRNDGLYDVVQLDPAQLPIDDGGLTSPTP